MLNAAGSNNLDFDLNNGTSEKFTKKGSTLKNIGTHDKEPSNHLDIALKVAVCIYDNNAKEKTVSSSY